MSKATVGGPGAAEINPELPPENAAQIRILYRELWKRTMKSVPDYGGMWKQYRLIGSEYEAVGFPEDALQSGYLPALELCNSGVLVGKDGLRKKAKILINVADAYLALGDIKSAIDNLYIAKTEDDRCALEQEVMFNLGMAYKTKGSPGFSRAEIYFSSSISLIDDLSKLSDVEKAIKRQKIHIQLADIKRAQADIPASLNLYRLALDDARDVNAALEILEKIVSASRQPPEDLLQILNSLTNRFPNPADSGKILIERAKFHESINDFTGAKQDLSRALESFTKASKEKLFSSFDESVEIQELSAWIEDLLPRLEEQSNLIEEANKQLQGPCSFVTGVELTLALCKGIEYYEQAERISIRGDWSRARDIIPLYQRLLAESSYCNPPAELYRFKLALGVLCEVSGDNRTAYQLLTEWLNDDLNIERPNGSLAKASFHLGNAMEALECDFQQNFSTYQMGYDAAIAIDDYEMAEQILENMEYLCVKHSQTQQAKQSRNLLRKLIKCKSTGVKNSAMKDIAGTLRINMPAKLSTTQTLPPPLPSAINDTVLPDTCGIRLNFLYNDSPLRSQTVLIINSTNYSEPISWLYMQAAELFRKKTGLIISIKCMYHDRNCDPLDPSDPIRSALPLPKELTVEVQELIVPEFPKQIVNLLAENKDSAVLKRFLSDKESNKEFSERGIIKLHSILEFTQQDLNALSVAFDTHLPVSQHIKKLSIKRSRITVENTNHLLKSMQASNFSQLTDIDFSYAQIDSGCLKAIVSHFLQCTADKSRLSKLDFSGCYFRTGSEFTELLCNMLKLPNLEHLLLNHVLIGDRQINIPDFLRNQLVQAFKEAKKLKHFTLMGDGLGDTVLGRLLSAIGSYNSLLELLDLSGNSLQADNGLAIEESACIGRCGHLRDLLLRGCGIGNNQLRSLCSFVIGRCVSLRHLDLSFNNFSDKGSIALAEAIQQHSCLESLSIAGNSYLSSSDTFRLLTAISGKSSIKRLDLFGCRLDETSLNAVSKLCKTSLEYLNINNCVDPEFATQLTDALLSLFLMTDRLAHCEAGWNGIAQPDRQRLSDGWSKSCERRQLLQHMDTAEEETGDNDKLLFTIYSPNITANASVSRPP